MHSDIGIMLILNNILIIEFLISLVIIVKEDCLKVHLHGSKEFQQEFFIILKVSYGIDFDVGPCL